MRSHGAAPRLRQAIALVLVLAASLVGIRAYAAGSAPYKTARGTARLIADTDSVAQGQALHVALDITPAPGWHTYWSNSGDAGAATTLALAAPGASVAPLAFPLPERLPDGPIMSFGYDREVLFTRALTPGAGTLSLTATADWLICKDLCVPEHAVFSLTLPAGPAKPSAEAPAIAAALRAVPGPAPWPTHIAPDGTLWLRGDPPGAAFFFPDSSDTTDLDAAQPAGSRDGVFALRLKPTASFKPGAGIAGVLAFGSGDGRVGYHIVATPEALPAAGEGAAVARVSLATLVFAFAGGLVLNLMPCVFPVLAMKAVGLAGLGGQARREVRMHALAYTAGVLGSFLALAAVVLGLRAAGAAAGWGFQFQWPGFVAAAMWLFFAIGLNMSGLFEIGGGLMGVGQGLASRGGALGSFATGLLAVLVATPCTAPFMGVAVAAASAAPPLQAVSVFVALGLGFSLPWTLLAVFPSLAGLMPRPGLWMERLRQALAFPMYAAAVWMLWVLAAEAGADGVLGAGAGCVLIGLAVWLVRLRAGRFATGGAVVAVIATVALLPAIARAPAGVAAQQSAAASEPFSVDRLQSLRDAHHAVLVDMTARWCVTCLVNERVAIAPALPVLRARGVTYLVGDWTRQDPAISAFLRQYGRDGVPLYVYFAPNQPGRTLPQILTPALLRGLPT